MTAAASCPGLGKYHCDLELEPGVSLGGATLWNLTLSATVRGLLGY
jgi:hypothetical protein